MCEVVIFKGDKECLSITPEDIDMMCRSCLNKEGTINIYETEYQGTLFSEMFCNFFSYDDSECYPEKICNACADTLADFFDFKQQIERSHAILRVALDENSEPFVLYKEPRGTNHGFQEKPFESAAKDIVEELNENQLFGCTENVMEEKVIISEESEDLLYQDDCLDTPDNQNRLLDDSMKSNENFNIKSNEEYEKKENTFNKDNKVLKVVLHKLNLNNVTYSLPQHRKRQIKKTRNRIRNIQQCSNCGSTFSSNKQLLSHKKALCITRTISPCPVCQKLVHQKDYKHHVNSHLKKSKPFICETCGYTFSTSFNLKKHQTRHEPALEVA